MYIINRVKSWLYALISFVYPNICIGCSTIIDVEEVACVFCWAAIKPIASLKLPVYRNKSIVVFAACMYDYPVKSLITAKFQSNIVACKKLALLMMDLLPKDVFDVDYIVPVPMHWQRYSYRGYNQAYEIALIIAKYKKLPLKDLLIRAKKTEFQWRLSLLERKKNVEQGFKVKEEEISAIKGKKILLIDDLCTTGATLSSVALTLYQVDVAHVSAAVACRPLY